MRGLFLSEDFGVGLGVVGDLDAELGAEVGDVGVWGDDGEADGGGGDVSGELADPERSRRLGEMIWKIGGAFEDDVEQLPLSKVRWTRPVRRERGVGGRCWPGMGGVGEFQTASMEAARVAAEEAGLSEHEGDDGGETQQQHGRHRPHPSNRDGRPCCFH